MLQFASAASSSVFVQTLPPYSVPQSCSTFLIRKREKFQNALLGSEPLQRDGWSCTQRLRARISPLNCAASSGSDGGSSIHLKPLNPVIDSHLKAAPYVGVCGFFYVSPISSSTTGSVCRTLSSSAKKAS